MFAVLASVLMVTAALVVDLGFARDVKRQSQTTADAAALAAANVLYPESGLCTADPAPGVPPCMVDAVNAAQAYAGVNFGPSDWAGCTDDGAYYVPPGSTPCISFTDETETDALLAQPTRVRVVVPDRDVPTGLGVLAGVEEVTVSTSARAALDPGTARSCGLCLLGTVPNELGNADVTINGGSVHSNGTINTGPMGQLTASPTPNAITTSGTCVGNCNPAAETGVPQIPDPYAEVYSFPLSYSPSTDWGTQNPCVKGPGVYGALELQNSPCALSPGVYVLTGMWTMKNNTVLSGTGVTLYGTCGTSATPQVCSGTAGGGLDGKNGKTQIVAPTTGPLAGMAVIYDPHNTAPMNLQGNGDSFVTGAIYAASSLMEFPGNSYFNVTNWADRGGPPLRQRKPGRHQPDQRSRRDDPDSPRGSPARPVSRILSTRQSFGGSISCGESSSTLTSLKVSTLTLRANRAGRYMSHTHASVMDTSKNTSPDSVRAFTSTWLHR